MNHKRPGEVQPKCLAIGAGMGQSKRYLNQNPPESTQFGKLMKNRTKDLQEACKRNERSESLSWQKELTLSCTYTGSRSVKQEYPMDDINSLRDGYKTEMK